jgi:RNA polymerase sigma-70 factor (ECF subfamily)
VSEEQGSGPTGPFVEHRSLLFTVAYEILGSAADAEDVVQETWLRWSARSAEADAEGVRDPRSYLVRIATRQALNRLRTQQRRRETYVGPWLPEPLLTTPDVAEDVELADSVSTAMLLVLETLRPTERAVFVLREVFDLPFDEIAEAVGKGPAAVRQIAHRARSHVHAQRPRQDVSAEERDRVIERFIAAAATGELQSLMDVLAPDVVLVSDGGGVKKAALRPIHGRDKVLRFLTATSQSQGPITAELVAVNGGPALAFSVAGELDTVATFVIENGVVTELYMLRNPEKLRRLRQVVDLTR